MKNSLKYIWLITAIIAIILGIVSTIKSGIAESYPLFIISVVAYLMYRFRKTINNLQTETPNS